MNLKKVYIYSGMTAQRAQNKINAMLSEYDESGTTVNFDLKIENSVIVGKNSETRYTLIVYVYKAIDYYDFLNGEPGMHE